MNKSQAVRFSAGLPIWKDTLKLAELWYLNLLQIEADHAVEVNSANFASAH